MGLINLGKGIGQNLKKRYEEEKLAAKKRAAVEKIIREKARIAALKEREKQIIRLAKEREKLKIEAAIKREKLRYTKPKVNSFVGNMGFGDVGGIDIMSYSRNNNKKQFKII